MATDFGNINKMTLEQFEEAKNFYNSRIERIKKDKNLDLKTRNWFLKNYTGRLKELQMYQEHLDQTINESRLSGAFIDEKTATLNNLGRPTTNEDALDILSQPTKNQKRAKVFKILGAIFIPIIGTIPFLVSLKRAKERQKNISKILTTENNEILRFKNESNRPYEKNIGNSGDFTAKDMQILMSNQSEIVRLERLLTSPLLNTIQKKNLTKKLIGLKEYAQTNGYSLIPGVLTDPKFDTSKDKQDKDINALTNSSNALISTIITSTKFIDYYNHIKELKEKKSTIEAFLNDNPNNAQAKTIIANIDNAIKGTTLRIPNVITNKMNALTRSLDNKNSPTPAPTTIADYEAIKVALDGVKNNEFKSKFGCDIESAKNYLQEIGLTTDEISLFETKHLSYISNADKNISELTVVNDYDNKVNFVNTEITKFEAGGIY